MAFNPYDHNARYDDVTAGFLAESRRNLFAAHQRIEHCLEQLGEEELWWRPQPGMNAVGNLLLHLAGNVGQWITSAVHNRASTRNRPGEFAQREPIAKAELRARRPRHTGAPTPCRSRSASRASVRPLRALCSKSSVKAPRRIGTARAASMQAKRAFSSAKTSMIVARSTSTWRSGSMRRVVHC